MKLKSLELYGFKSFADRSKLVFEKDIAAIVGPNGSGKSNISDAIRWVLGEQSAKSLRGSNMSDVIFSGTDEKSQMNMASVSLTLDNSDKSLDLEFNEVNVTRKVFRTGESEYILNKAPVRLKDIRELFLDTGIGKDGYSIIGQGRIDDILNGRSEDRRYIFEEASGIAKFKYKKTESERKLLKNEESLTKLKNELKVKEQEVELLETQANNAKEGVKLTSLLERMELSLLKSNLEKLETDRVKFQAEREEKLDILKKDNSRLIQLSERISPVEKEIEDLNNKLEIQREEAIKTDKTIAKSKSEISLLQEQIKFYTNDIERLSQEALIRKEKYEDNIRNTNEGKIKLKELKDKRTYIDKLILDISREKNSLETDIKSLDEKVSGIKIKIEGLKSKLSQLNIDKSTKEQLDKSNLLKKEEYEDKLKYLEHELTENKLDLDKKKTELNDLNKKVDINTSEIAKFIDLRAANQAKLDEKNKTLEDLRSHFYKIRSQREVLYSIYKSYEGYYKPIQNLLKARDKDENVSKRIVGVLADLIEVDKAYKTAVDVCLSSSLQNIVVENEENAKYLIDYIKKNNLGRITFLPINKISGQKTNIKHELVIGSLNNLIKFDSRIGGIIDHFLSRTALVKNMNDAIIISKELKGIRIVTLDGDIINSWGSMVGGSVYKKESNSLLNRQAEIKKLDKILLDTEKEAKVIAKELEVLKNEYEDILGNLSNLDHENSKFINNRNNLYSLVKELEFKLDYVTNSKKDLNKQISNMEDELKEVDFNSISELEEELNKFNNLYNSIEDEKFNKSSRLMTLEKDLIKNEADFEHLVKDISILEDEIEELLSDKDSLLNLDKLEGEKKLNLEKEEKLARSKIDSLNINIEKYENKLQGGSEDLKIFNKELEELTAKIKQDSLEIEKLKDSINILDREVFQLDLKLESEESKRDDLFMNHCENYDISKKDLLTKLDNFEIIKSNRKEINDVKSKLSKIGFFNFASIEQYNIEKENLDFIREQFEDLTQTKTDIISMIKKLEREMISLFKESFKKINDKFGQVFQVLFDGGEAQLLLDGEDVLTAGIEIVAKPPGKKLKNIGLLSGGEKALTAVALLFSIFEINPAPFCVLDEIDAALDEANIRRYIQYLRRLTDKTQFIIITHRKVTMEMAEILYGVTMEEKGISKVITLALDDYREE